ncbi:hypothetical protein GCM10009657_16940 [Oryzihumus leptocrescens]
MDMDQPLAPPAPGELLEGGHGVEPRIGHRGEDVLGHRHYGMTRGGHPTPRPPHRLANLLSQERHGASLGAPVSRRIMWVTTAQ